MKNKYSSHPIKDKEIINFCFFMMRKYFFFFFFNRYSDRCGYEKNMYLYKTENGNETSSSAKISFLISPFYFFLFSIILLLFSTNKDSPLYIVLVSIFKYKNILRFAEMNFWFEKKYISILFLNLKYKNTFLRSFIPVID